MRNPSQIACSVCIVLAATVVGLTANALRPDGLPLIRKPLRETRTIVAKEYLLSETQTRHGVMEQAPRQPSAISALSEQEPLQSDSVTKVADQTIHEKRPAEEAPPVSLAGSTSRKLAMLSVKTPVESVPARRPPKKAEALFTTLDDAKALFDSGEALFLDARPIEDFDYEHIKGAVYLYFEELDKLYEQVLAGIDKARIIITYCSDPECTEAVKLGDELVARGHTKVVILLEGLPGWKDAGYPTEGKGVAE